MLITIIFDAGLSLYFQVSVALDLYPSALPRHPSARYGTLKLAICVFRFTLNYGRSAGSKTQKILGEKICQFREKLHPK
jgi:hypothetical protein